MAGHSASTHVTISQVFRPDSAHVPQNDECLAVRCGGALCHPVRQTDRRIVDVRTAV